MTWQILARSPDLEIVGLLQSWDLDLTLRFNEVGSWSLSVPLEATPEGWPTAGAGIIIVRDNAVIASGCIEEQGFDWSADASDDAGGRGLFKLSGDTDLARLAYSVCYPSPSLAWKDQPTDPATHYTYPLPGQPELPAEEVMRVLINWQAGSLARPSRQVPGLRLSSTTTYAGLPTRVSERFTPLLDALRRLADAGGGLAVDVRDTLDGYIDITITETQDRTLTARFARELGNLESLSVRHVAPTATAVLIAAQLDKDSESPTHGRRLLAEYANPSDYGRREFLVDQRQVDDSLSDIEQKAEYQKAANEAFESNGERTSVSAVIVDTPAVRWGRDFNLGDKVAALSPFGPVEDLVREVRITVDTAGVEDISSVVGSPNPEVHDPLADYARRLELRVSQLERGL